MTKYFILFQTFPFAMTAISKEGDPNVVVVGKADKCGLGLFSLQDKPNGSYLFSEGPKHFTHIDIRKEIPDNLRTFSGFPALITLFELIKLNNVKLLDKYSCNEVFVCRRKTELQQDKPFVDKLIELQKLVSKETGSSYTFGELADYAAIIKTNVVLSYTLIGSNILGLGIYDITSRMNHSCSPNCKLVFSDDGTVNVYSVSKIGKYDELTYDYIGLDVYCCHEVRRERLLRRCRFVCQCQKCVKEDIAANGNPCTKPSHIPKTFEVLLSNETDIKVKVALKLMKETHDSNEAQYFKIYFQHWMDIIAMYERNQAEFLIFKDVIKLLRALFSMEESVLNAIKPGLVAFSLTCLDKYLAIALHKKPYSNYTYGFYWELCLSLLGILLIMSDGRKDNDKQKVLRKLYECIFYTLMCRFVTEIPNNIQLYIQRPKNYMMIKALQDKANREMKDEELDYFMKYLSKQTATYREYREAIEEKMNKDETDEDTKYGLLMIERWLSNVDLARDSK
jgi:hypothetical protein